MWRHPQGLSVQDAPDAYAAPLDDGVIVNYRLDQQTHAHREIPDLAIDKWKE